MHGMTRTGLGIRGALLWPVDRRWGAVDDAGLGVVDRKGLLGAASAVGARAGLVVAGEGSAAVLGAWLLATDPEARA